MPVITNDKNFERTLPATSTSSSSSNTIPPGSAWGVPQTLVKISEIFCVVLVQRGTEAGNQ
eukprot:1890680-Rhodomonas_salina.1